MNKFFLIPLFIICNLQLATRNSYAQDKIDTIKIEIVKEYVPTISDAFKINDNPRVYDTLHFTPKVKYSIKSKKVETEFEVEPVKPARIKGEPLIKLYRNYVKAGLGTYSTPFAEVFMNNLRSRKYNYGVHVKHLSSTGKLKDVGYSGFSNNELNLYGKKFLRKHTLTGDGFINRDVVHYYGFNPNNSLINGLDDTIIGKDAIKQRFFYWSTEFRLISHYSDSAILNHEINVKFNHISDIYGLHDHNFLLSGRASRYWGNDFYQINAELDYYNNNIPDTSGKFLTKNSTIISINPSVRTSGTKYLFRIGVKAFFETGAFNSVNFYPSVDLNFNFMDEYLIFYSGVSGMLKRNSFKGLTDENPFLISNADIRNSNYVIQFFGGFKGAFSSTASFNLQISHDKIEEMPFFVNDTSGILDNKFTLVYDNIELFAVHGEFSHQKSDKLKLLFSADYYTYTMDKVAKPWHKPTFQLTASGTYNLEDKIIINGEIFIFNSQYARGVYDVATKKYLEEKIKGMADINLGVEYRYTKKLSAFINLNNIASYRYSKWYKYPTQRFSILGGFTYGF